MSINKAPLPIQFTGGVDTRTDSKQVPTVKLLDLRNCIFTKKTTLSKRTGYAARSTAIQNGGGSIVNARGLGQRDGEILLFTDKRCFSQRPSADRWADTGEVAATTATTLPVARTGSYQTQPDVADRHGVRVVAWEDSRGGVWCSVIEAETDRILLSQTQLDSSASAKNPTCLAVGDVLHVLWTREDLQQIQLAVVNPATPTAPPVVAALTADLDGTKPFYDAISTVDGDQGSIVRRPGLIAWAQAGGGWRVGWIDPSGVLGSPASGLSSVATYADILSGPLAVAWNAPFQQVAVVISSTAFGKPGLTLVQGHSLTTVDQAMAPIGATSAAAFRIACEFGAKSAFGSYVLYWAMEVTAARSDLTTVVAGAADPNNPPSFATSTTLRGHGLVSRAWRDGDLVNTATNGDVYVMVAHTARLFPYVAALRLSDDSGISSPGNSIVSRLMPGEASGSLMRTTGAATRAWTQHLPSVTQQLDSETALFSRQHMVVVPYRIQLSSQNGDQFSEQGLKLCTLDFDVPYLTEQLGRGLYLASSAPMHYDGDAWHEADFHAAPDIGFDAAGAPVLPSSLIAIDGAGSVADGAYLYAWWYEAVDAQGELHRSAPSVKILVTMIGGPKSFSMTLPTCRLTRFSNVRICVARSEAGATGTDSSLPLYRVTSNDVTVTTGNNRYVNNDPTVDTVTFVDALDDATVKTREPLYTNGGVLPNAPAPWGGAVLAVGKSRLFYDDSTDPNIIRFTQQITDDTALEAPIDLTLRKDPFGGPIVAIGIMDDTVIPFSETATYVFAGPGPLANPNAAPEANAFTPVELISTDVGCVDVRSVGQTPVGLTFKSAKGIQMITRNREVLPIGNDVKAYDAQRVVRSTLIPSADQIVYLTDSGRTLMWDYNRNQWSTYTNHEGLDAVVVNGLYCYLRNDSRLFVETPGLYLDDNAVIPMAIETAWIHFADYLQGWQKILWAYFLGKYISAHTLSVRYRLDYNDGYSPAILSNVNSNYNPSVYGAGLYGVGLYGGSPFDGSTRYQRRLHLDKRCQSISFLIEDVEATGDAGASFELSELLIIGGGLGPDFKVGTARSA